MPALQGEVTSGFMMRSQVMYYISDETGHCLDGFDSFMQAIEEFNKL